MADRQDRPQVTNTPKKRKINDSKAEVLKKQRLASHSVGADCLCSRFKCFETTAAEERERLVANLNAMLTKDEQDSWLSSMVKVKPVERRRPRMDVQGPAPNDHSYSYTVPIVRGGEVANVQVCFKAFLSFFGITKRRVQTIKTATITTGLPPKDQRGKHHNHPHRFSEEQLDRIEQHIGSFRGRESHYSRHKTRRLYLAEELSIATMHSMYCDLHPGDSVSYESYRKVFNTRFNIAFGYPRTDTCSKCDSIRAQLDQIAAKLLSNGADANLYQQQTRLQTEKEIHQRKAENFYQRKKAAKDEARTSDEILALAFDFQREMPCPNKTTNDIYYRRQLSLHSFNIHALATDSVHIYAYEETVAKKGADEVTSMLAHYFTNFVPESVRTLKLFCDSCCGQNKNYTMVRFLYFYVHCLKRFDLIKVTFPERGHSYMECDRDLGLVNRKADVEVPRDWMEVFRSARKNPSPYRVIEVTQEDIFGNTQFLKPMFKATCAFPTRPIRELVIRKEKPMLVEFRNNWNGGFSDGVIVARGEKAKRGAAAVTAGHPERLYAQPIPVSEAKFKDLQVLKNFCTKESSLNFFTNLPNDCDAADHFHDQDSDSDSDTD